MAKCSLCGKDIKFGQQSFTITALDGKICFKCQQEITKKRTLANDCDVEYLKDLTVTASTVKNRNYIESLFSVPADFDSFSAPEEIPASEIRKIIDTTGFDVSGYSITEYKGVIFSESVIGTGAFSEIAASVSDFLGTKSDAFTKKLADVRNDAMLKLKKEAYRAGANAIIGVALEYTMFLGNIIGVAARGTAVVIQKS